MPSRRLVRYTTSQSGLKFLTQCKVWSDSPPTETFRRTEPRYEGEGYVLSQPFLIDGAPHLWNYNDIIRYHTVIYPESSQSHHAVFYDFLRQARDRGKSAYRQCRSWSTSYCYLRGAHTPQHYARPVLGALWRAEPQNRQSAVRCTSTAMWYHHRGALRPHIF